MMSEADVQILQSGTENDLDAMLKRFNAAVSWISFIDFWLIFIDLYFLKQIYHVFIC